MKVTHRLGEPFWRQINARQITLDLPEAATFRDMIQALKDAFPALASYLLGEEVPLTVIVADELVQLDTVLAEGAEAMMFMAIAGG